MATVVSIEARIAELGRTRLMYGNPSWTVERAGSESLKIKQLLNQIEELNTWRTHKKESVIRVNVLRKRIDLLTTSINSVDKNVPEGVTKEDFSSALRLRRKHMQDEIDYEFLAHPPSVPEVIPVVTLAVDIGITKGGSWADEN